MSAVSSVSNFGLAQWLLQLSPGATGGTISPAARLRQQQTQLQNSTTSTAAGTARTPGSPGDGIALQLQYAIAAALNAPTGATNPNQVIQDTIKQLVAPPQQTDEGDEATTTTADESDPTAAAAASNDAAAASGQQSAFSQLLTSYGVNAAQFQQDLQSALQGNATADGSVNYAQVFQNFPPGSTLDVSA